MPRVPLHLIILLTAALAGCAPPPPADGTATAERPAASAPTAPAPAEEMPMATCDATKAQFAVGRPYTDTLAAEAQAAAGARLVRRLVPGQMVTMEFNGARLNLETDAAGRVAAVRCG